MEGHRVILQLNNLVEQATFAQYKQSFLAYLRQALNYAHLQLEVDCIGETSAEKEAAATPLLEEYPALNFLANALGLQLVD